MNERDDEQIKALLRRALAPEKSELREDLWPRMALRLQQSAQACAEEKQRWKERLGAVPWFDWALAATVLLCIGLSPKLIPVLLYHL